MALRASLRESRTHVVRVGRPLEILQVATDASGICGGQVVIAVHVALQALHRRMCPTQREAGSGVVKGRIVPRRRAVALLARLRESRLHVVWVGRAVEILHMARGAIGGRAHKLPVDVALRAGNGRVCARQLELRKHVVVERRRIPRAAVVAGLASRRESRLRMRRIICLIEVRQVAADAGRWSSHELVARMAGIAVQGGVRARQGKPGELHMVELRAHPVVHRMARLAGGRQIQSDVVNAD